MYSMRSSRQLLFILAAVFALAVSAIGMPGRVARAASYTFSNTTSITIVDSNASNVPQPSTPIYPTPITVSGVLGNVTAVTITMRGLNHTFISDIDMLLVAPNGNRILVASDVGGSSDYLNVNITIDDAAATGLPTGNVNIATGSYKPTNFSNTVGSCPADPDTAFPSPAPSLTGAGVFTTMATAFNGLNGASVNGVWSLYVVDDCAALAGSMTGGWSITITDDDTVISTNTPTATNTPTSTDTPTATSTDTPTDTPTATDTPTDTPTFTFTPSDTPTSTFTPSDTPTGTPTPSNTPTETFTPSNTPTLTPSNTPTNTATFTLTPSNTPTFTPSNTATNTATKTNTPVPPRPDTIGVYKGGVFSLRNTNNAGAADITVAFGGDVSDLPVTGDWNGDGVDTIGVYRSSTGFFYLSDSNTSPALDYNPLFGNPGDAPFAGKWTADMTHDGIGVYRNSNGILYQRKTLTGGFDDFFAIYGNPGDIGFAGDWEANGFDSIGIYRSSNQTWYLTNNSTPSGITFSDIDFVWDISINVPVVGDWDANGTSTAGYFTALGVFDLHSTNAAAGSDNVFAFGPTAGKPVAGKWIAPSKPPLGGLISGAKPGSSGGNADTVGGID